MILPRYKYFSDKEKDNKKSKKIKGVAAGFGGYALGNFINSFANIAYKRTLNNKEDKYAVDLLKKNKDNIYKIEEFDYIRDKDGNIKEAKPKQPGQILKNNIEGEKAKRKNPNLILLKDNDLNPYALEKKLGVGKDKGKLEKILEKGAIAGGVAGNAVSTITGLKAGYDEEMTGKEENNLSKNAGTGLVVAGHLSKLGGSANLERKVIKALEKKGIKNKKAKIAAAGRLISDLSLAGADVAISKLTHEGAKKIGKKMILLRQKYFTFQDQRVLEEWKNATNNFKDLPKGIDGMTARDVFRLHDATSKANNLDGSVPLNQANINWDDVNTLSKHIGLPELGKGAEHILHKFTDPAIRERYIRMHSTKKGYETHKEIKNLQSTRRNRLDRLSKADVFPFGSSKKGENNGKRQIRLEKEIQEHYNTKMDKLRSTLRASKSIIPTLKTAAKAYIPCIKALKNEFTDTSDTKKGLGIVKNELAKGGHTLDIKSSGKFGSNVRIDGESGTCKISVTPDAAAKKNFVPVAMHEIGHPEWLKRLTRVSGYKGPEKIDPKIYENSLFGIAKLGNENGATSEAISRLRKGGASEEEVEKAKRCCRNAYRTYFYNAEMNLADKLSAPKIYYTKGEVNPRIAKTVSKVKDKILKRFKR